MIQFVVAELTIEQLAARSGMSVRNIRAHQARGLLAAPEVRLRVGYYGPEHVDRLRLIRELQDEGFNLAGIKRLVDDRNGTAERLAQFGQVLTESPAAERPATVSAAELGRRFGVSLDGAWAVFAAIEEHCDGVSEAFVSLFVTEVWQPFQAAGMPIERWPEIEAAVGDLRPLATDALLAIFGQRMQAQLDAVFDQRNGDRLPG